MASTQDFKNEQKEPACLCDGSDVDGGVGGVSGSDDRRCRDGTLQRWKDHYTELEWVQERLVNLQINGTLDKAGEKRLEWVEEQLCVFERRIQKREQKHCEETRDMLNSSLSTSSSSGVGAFCVGHTRSVSVPSVLGNVSSFGNGNGNGSGSGSVSGNVNVNGNIGHVGVGHVSVGHVSGFGGSGNGVSRSVGICVGRRLSESEGPGPGNGVSQPSTNSLSQIVSKEKRLPLVHVKRLPRLMTGCHTGTPLAIFDVLMFKREFFVKMKNEALRECDWPRYLIEAVDGPVKYDLHEITEGRNHEGPSMAILDEMFEIVFRETIGVDWKGWVKREMSEIRQKEGERTKDFARRFMVYVDALGLDEGCEDVRTKFVVALRSDLVTWLEHRSGQCLVEDKSATIAWVKEQATQLEDVVFYYEQQHDVVVGAKSRPHAHAHAQPKRNIFGGLKGVCLGCGKLLDEECVPGCRGKVPLPM